MEIINRLLEKYPNVTCTEGVMGGQPCIVGTRMPVSTVLTAVAHFGSIQEFLDDYDNRYTVEQVKDAFRFTRDFLDSMYRTVEEKTD